jgi:hypothetical protein
MKLNSVSTFRGELQCSASWPDNRQRLGLGHAQLYAFLKQPEQIAGLLPALLGKWQRSNFPVQPGERLACRPDIFLIVPALRHRSVLAN